MRLTQVGTSTLGFTLSHLRVPGLVFLAARVVRSTIVMVTPGFRWFGLRRHRHRGCMLVRDSGAQPRFSISCDDWAEVGYVRETPRTSERALKGSEGEDSSVLLVHTYLFITLDGTIKGHLVVHNSLHPALPGGISLYNEARPVSRFWCYLNVERRG
ncbi:hypothetical protein BDN67DRAFT_964264 [Paxillus ammoniavirescens]|nr:hypothetical protein BDN67DRAFT_964264 [Paxillus ammoniavirescens]